MRRSSAISFGIAIVCAGVATLLVRALVIGAGSPDVAETRMIVVAGRPIGFGAALTADNLREVSWPAGQPMAGSFHSIAELSRGGRRLSLAPLQQNEPVLATKVTGPDQKATLSTQIEDGMRAVSVRVDEVRGVAGFILPGDHVDVVLTRGEAAGQDVAAYADLLLQGIKVLAVDQLANERQDKPSIARAVTLEVTAFQAQRVILAQGIGHLSLILRQAGEPTLATARRVTTADLGERVTATSTSDGGELQAKVDALGKAIEEKSAHHIAELEARLRGEIARNALSTMLPPPPSPLRPFAALAAPNPVVIVTRNGSKREPYTVAAEQ